MNDYHLTDHLRHSTPDNWITFVILLTIAAFVLARLFYPNYWHRYLQAMIFPIEADKLLHEKNSNLLQVSFILNFLAVISLSLFLYLATAEKTIFAENLQGARQYTVYFLIISGLTVIKFFGTQMLGVVFKNEEVATQFNHIWLIHLKFFGFLLLMWSVMMKYLPDQLVGFSFYGGWATLFTMLIMNNIRGFLVMNRSNISLLYGILYLCSLEFLPVLMIVRLIKM